MSARPKHIEFAPPAPEGTGRSVGASLVVHALLIVALTAGIQWKQDNSLSVEAELWSAVPMAAAPKLVEVEAPPPPPAPKPEPAPKPVVKAPEPPAPNRDADIALAKKRKLEEEKKIQEALKAEERRKEERITVKSTGTVNKSVSSTLKGLARDVQELQGESSQGPVVITADRTIKYETVVKAMDTLQRAGVQRVGLAVQLVD